MTTTSDNNLAELLLENPNSLIDMLEENMNETDHDEPSLMQNSPYYNNTDFIKFIENKSDCFTMISLNCQSLNAKFDQIKYYIESYNTESHTISAICLQETWLTAGCDISMYHIPGYQLISEGKSCSAHGGVAIYLHESLSFISIDFDSESDCWDGQFIEIVVENNNNESKTLVLGNIYRPPRQTTDMVNVFINEFESICNRLQSYKHVMLTGDYNINLLKFRENNMVNTFLECVLSCSYVPKITLSTNSSYPAKWNLDR